MKVGCPRIRESVRRLNCRTIIRMQNMQNIQNMQNSRGNITNPVTKPSCQVDHSDQDDQDEMLCQLNNDEFETLDPKTFVKPCIYIAYSLNNVVYDTLDAFCKNEPYDEQCRMFDVWWFVYCILSRFWTGDC